MKTRMKKLLAGMCAVLILPIGSAQTVLAEEPEQNFPISVEKAVNQTLKLWTVLLPKLILPNPAAANGCSNLCLSETGIWEI